MSEVLTKPVTIDLVADVVCPYCYLGWRRLRQALSRRPAVTAQVSWRPFQLNPDLPAEGVDQARHMAKIIPDPGRLKAAHDNLASQGAPVGIDFQFGKIEREPNTSGAHLVILWAAAEGRQDEAIEAMFSAHFTEGRFIADPEVLADIAATVGLDRATVLQRLKAGKDAESVRQSHEMAVRGGVTGVPCTIFDSRFALVGAESTDRFVQALDKVTEA
ncbi:MAG: DsbA family oxidoreductase [Caulobacteraceae bacterium]